ncbi:MAG: hypothetical protein P3C10_08900 [Gemmatimonadota bacterium]|nr:hypothetical protein [Gemmatimonadota bacterium]
MTDIATGERLGGRGDPFASASPLSRVGEVPCVVVDRSTLARRAMLLATFF